MSKQDNPRWMNLTIRIALIITVIYVSLRQYKLITKLNKEKTIHNKDYIGSTCGDKTCIRAECHHNNENECAIYSKMKECKQNCVKCIFTGEAGYFETKTGHKYTKWAFICPQNKTSHNPFLENKQQILSQMMLCISVIILVILILIIGKIENHKRQVKRSIYAIN